VREIIDAYAVKSSCGKVVIHKAERNLGLARSVIQGVTGLVNDCGRVIVLEDDLVLAPDCISFMDRALDYYEGESLIGAVSGYSLPIRMPKGYNHDVYLSRTGNSWGWGTWASVWNAVDWDVSDYDEFKNDDELRSGFDKVQTGITRMLDDQMAGRIDSWAVRWDYHFFRNGLVTLYPVHSKVGNEGFDGDGTHCGKGFFNRFATGVMSGDTRLEMVGLDEAICR
jgi:GT2 family glycosyltransferase